MLRPGVTDLWNLPGRSIAMYQIEGSDDMTSDRFGAENQPFRLTPGAAPCFVHDGFAQAQDYLQFVVDNREGMFLLTGATGTGKTCLLQETIEPFRDSRVRMVPVSCNPVSPNVLLREILTELGGTVQAKDEHVLGNLRQLLRVSKMAGFQSVLILDEAQVLSDAALEQVRLLSNLQDDAEPLLQVFLLGQEELRERLEAEIHAPLRQRIVASSRLGALSAEESTDYIAHLWTTATTDDSDLPFDDDALARIHDWAQGNPRLINQICSRALLHAQVDDKAQLTESDMQAVIDELEQEGLLPSANQDKQAA